MKEYVVKFYNDKTGDYFEAKLWDFGIIPAIEEAHNMLWVKHGIDAGFFDCFYAAEK